jgi:MFS family permease
VTAPRTAVRRLALGRVISMTGTFAAGTALTFTIYQQTRSTAWISATMLLTWAVIGFLGPLAGAVGDRFDRRRVMIVSESASAVCWLVMALVTHSPWLLLVIAFASSVSEAPYFPASSAAIPTVSSEDDFSEGLLHVTAMSFGGWISQLVASSPIGGARRAKVRRDRVVAPRGLPRA